VADEHVAELQSQLGALQAARELVQESSHLDEFLLALQNAQLAHDEDFNRLLQVLRLRAVDVGGIEQGLMRLDERLDALRAEAEALRVTSVRLRGEIQLNSEQLRHTALRLTAAMEEAQDGTDELLAQRVALIEAFLNHQQAVNEALNARRALVEEALSAANDQLKRYQDSLHLLESYVSGALRLNLGTLQQSGRWLGEALRSTRLWLQRLPAYWLELRLSLQQPARRSRAVTVAAGLALFCAMLLVLDRLLARWLRRRRAEAGVGAPRSSWLMTGPGTPADAPVLPKAAPEAVPGPFLMPQAPQPHRSAALRVLVYTLGRLHRPLELGALALFGCWFVP
jgi:hypothetical protein